MSAEEVTQALLAELDKDKFDAIILNFANPDMVGHTGVLSAAITAGKFKRIYPWEEGCFCGTEYRNI